MHWQKLYSSNWQGQVEYEMPLLAPVKDKREMDLAQEASEKESGKDFVHIALRNKSVSIIVDDTDFVQLVSQSDLLAYTSACSIEGKNWQTKKSVLFLLDNIPLA